MLPRYHIVLGFIFSILVLFIFPSIGLLNFLMLFFASFLIDFDHYLNAVIKTKSLNIFKAFKYYKKQGIRESLEEKRGIKKKGDFHIFHTIEFITFVTLLGFVWQFFFFISIGMIFHSILDITYLIFNSKLYKREFSLANWISKKLNKKLRGI